MSRFVEAAGALAARRGFALSCLPEVGRLLASLAGTATTRVAESGTGCGVGTAWLHSGLRPGVELVTVERDTRLAAEVAALFAGEPAVTVLPEDWRALFRYAPMTDRQNQCLPHHVSGFSCRAWEENTDKSTGCGRGGEGE